MTVSLLKQNFDNDKKFLIDKTQEFLKDSSEFGEPLRANRDDVNDAVKNGNFIEALQKLEILREDKAGIKLIKIERKDDSTPILIRDGRENSNESRILGTEAFEMQYLNTIRGAIDIAESENKPELVLKLKEEAVKFISSPNALNMKESQKDLSKKITSEIDDIAKLLSENGVKDAHKKLNIAKDFQNFNDQHYNIVTLSKVTDKQGKDYTVVEAEVALKGLTGNQKQEYQHKADKKWFTKMPELEQKLVDKYANVIQNGKHVIPTQLRQIVGMKNAFEKITAIADKDGENFKELHNSKHAGTLASLSYDKDSRQEITNLNAEQAQELMKGKILHTNTLNSGPIGAGNDPEIVKLTREAMKNVKGKNTNTAFNLARLAGGANNLSGTKDFLEKIAENSPEELKTHIKPRGRFERLFGVNKPAGNIKELIDKSSLEPHDKEILRSAVKLREDVEKADVPFRLFGDKENINLKISTTFNFLTEKIANTSSTLLNQKEEILTMCASGKDRTGLSMHDQTTWAVANELNISIDELDKQLLKNGHTAEQAGSIYAGGATIGCYGTKGENKAGIPKSRKYLDAIMEITAKTNKIEDKKRMDKKFDKEYEKSHPQESVTIRSDKKVVKPLTQSVSQLKPSITPTVKSNKDKNISI